MANQTLQLPTKLEVGNNFQILPATPALIFGTGNTYAFVEKYIIGNNNTATGVYGSVYALGHTNTFLGANFGGSVYSIGNNNDVRSDGFVGGVQVTIGHNNGVNVGDANTVFGINNTSYGKRGITAGNSNTMTTNVAYCEESFIFGYGNYMSDASWNLLVGYQNNIYKTNHYNIVAGQGNTLTDNSGALHNAVFGQKNTVNGGDMNLVSGGTATTGHSVTGNNNIVGGGQGGGNTVGGYNNIVLGWGSNVAGHDCYVNGQTNTVTAGGNSIVVGRNNVHTSGGNNILVGYGNAIAADNAAIFGEANTGATYSLMYGRQNLCSATHTMAGGSQSHATNYAERALASGWWGSGLYAQTSELVLKVSTTDATVTELANPIGFLTIANNTAYTFVVTVTAKDTANTDHASYRLKWSTVRGAGVATVTVDGLVKEVIFESQAAWDVTVTADTTNGRPAIKVTGEVGKTIHWVARVEITETP